MSDRINVYPIEKEDMYIINEDAFGRQIRILANSLSVHQNVAPTESGEVANQPQLIQVSRSKGPSIDLLSHYI
jgi:hypothetical protein